MIIVLMGVTGSGKTSVGHALSALSGWEFLDADSYHCPENITKMSRGEPLSDGDREPWLNILRAVIQARIDQGGHTILACSALKRAYRLRLAQADPRSMRFVYLKVSAELLQARLKHRQDHFMPPAMLTSQLATLEEPQEGEALIVQVNANTSAEVLAADIQNKLECL